MCQKLVIKKKPGEGLLIACISGFAVLGSLPVSSNFGHSGIAANSAKVPRQSFIQLMQIKNVIRRNILIRHDTDFLGTLQIWPNLELVYSTLSNLGSSMKMFADMSTEKLCKVCLRRDLIDLRVGRS